MALLVKDLMVTDFDTIGPEATVQEAIRLMRFSRHSPRGRRIFGLMVVDGSERLVGMISMYDILHHVRPPFKKVWEDRVGLDWGGQFRAACERAKKLRVGDIMTHTVVTIEEGTDITQVIDLMTKHHIRRLPVLHAGRICGILYISEVFQEACRRLTATHSARA